MQEAPRESLKVVRLKGRDENAFRLKADWPPAGDQPNAIQGLVERLLPTRPCSA